MPCDFCRLKKLIAELLENNAAVLECRPEMKELIREIANIETKRKEILTQSDFEFAVHSQSACNLSGIVFHFADTMHRIVNEARKTGHATDWWNSHPICRLYAEQICHLTRKTDWQKAYDECERMAGKKE